MFQGVHPDSELVKTPPSINFKGICMLRCRVIQLVLLWMFGIAFLRNHGVKQGAVGFICRLPQFESCVTDADDSARILQIASSCASKVC